VQVLAETEDNPVALSRGLQSFGGLAVQDFAIVCILLNLHFTCGLKIISNPSDDMRCDTPFLGLSF
jgi:hypothetical protein